MSKLTYISLFSSAGVGCFGFQLEKFDCIATNEIIERRLAVQRFNKKCKYDTGYVSGDITATETQQAILDEIKKWETLEKIKEVDVLIATPPCQGMSVANHKKHNDEILRNSLVTESIKLIKKILPRFFVIENVPAFLKTICTDTDGVDRPIREAIDRNLLNNYSIYSKVINFKDYGVGSSRTRTLVIGVRLDWADCVSPIELFPDASTERTLRNLIGHLKSLTEWGEIDSEDIYHAFRIYPEHMRSWISGIKEGQSAFDNTDPDKIPHTIVDGVRVVNKQKNGDKYKRQYWDKIAPCIHTRNDIMASQNTVHPVDNRVFSIREVMLMMSVPSSFNWSDIPFDELNRMSLKEKEAFLKKEEMNIRQNLGEAVPTVIFKQIAAKVRKILCKPTLSEQDIKVLIDKKNLATHSCLVDYIRGNSHYDFAELSKIAELANAQREDNAAYYTRQDICYTIVKSLPDAKNYTELNILEPSIGVGNFLPALILKYAGVQSVNIDVVDIDANSLEILKELVAKIDVPNNIHINYINADFLLHNFDKRYDIVVGNPPYKKLTKEKQLLAKYKIGASNKDTNNIFSFFIEKAMRIGNVVSLIVPKSLINAPEFDATRTLMKEKNISRIIDFGEKGFKGVKIETICFILDTQKKPQNTFVESYITDEVKCHQQAYLTDDRFPYWIIYRNEAFDEVADKMEFNVFKAYRDRVITKAITKDNGKIRVLKSRNIGNNEIVNIPDYDCYIDSIEGLDVAKYLNQANCVLLPNLTYNPRACFLPKGCIADGSVAILTLAKDDDIVTKEDLAFYATDSFTKFYAIARNLGTRSLNIDNNSVFFFGKLKQQRI